MMANRVFDLDMVSLRCLLAIEKKLSDRQIPIGLVFKGDLRTEAQIWELSACTWPLQSSVWVYSLKQEVYVKSEGPRVSLGPLLHLEVQQPTGRQEKATGDPRETKKGRYLRWEGGEEGAVTWTPSEEVISRKAHLGSRCQWINYNEDRGGH